MEMRVGVIRAEGNGLVVLGLGSGPVAFVTEFDARERRVGFCKRRIQYQGFDGSFPGFGIGFSDRESAANVQRDEGVRDAGIGSRVYGIFSDGFLEVVESFPCTVAGPRTQPVAALQKVVI